MFLQPVRSFAQLGGLLYSKAPQDDLVTKIAKIAYRILEHLFNLIEKGMDYLMHDPRPKPFHIRYKWSIRIAVIALSIIGSYYGVQYVRNKIYNYFGSFIPDFNPDSKENIYNGAAESLANLFKSRDTVNTTNINQEPESVISQILGFNTEQSEVDKQTLSDTIQSMFTGKDHTSDVEKNLFKSRSSVDSTNVNEESESLASQVLGFITGYTETDEQNHDYATQKTFEKKSYTSTNTGSSDISCEGVSKEGVKFLQYFESLKSVAFDLGDAVYDAKRIIKEGSYNLMHYALEQNGIKQPAKYLDPLSNLFIGGLFFLAVYKILIFSYLINPKKPVKADHDSSIRAIPASSPNKKQDRSLSTGKKGLSGSTKISTEDQLNNSQSDSEDEGQVSREINASDATTTPDAEPLTSTADPFLETTMS